MDSERARLMDFVCTGRAVKNATHYGWEPRRLLDQLTDIYLHLDGEVFWAALAADERSFRYELFEEAARLERARIKTESQIVFWRRMALNAHRLVLQVFHTVPVLLKSFTEFRWLNPSSIESLMGHWLGSP